MPSARLAAGAETYRSIWCNPSMALSWSTLYMHMDAWLCVRGKVCRAVNHLMLHHREVLRPKLKVIAGTNHVANQCAPSASSYSMMRMRTEAASQARQGMPRLARRLLSDAGVMAATAEHSEHTSWLMLPCISTVCPAPQTHTQP